MTSTPVTSITNLFSSAASTNSTYTHKSGELTKSFTQVMGNAANTNTTMQQFENHQNENSVHQQESVDQSENTAKGSEIQKENDTVKDQKSTEKVTESANKTGNTDTEINDEMKQELANKADKLVSEVAEALDVSEDELKAMMELMGIQAVDLLNPDTMAQLVVKVSGETDMLSVVMDEQLYGTLTDLIESADNMLQELEEQFQVSLETLSKAIDELKMEVTESDSKNVISQESAELPQQNIVVADDSGLSGNSIVVVEKEAIVQSKVPEQNEAQKQGADTTNAEVMNETDATNEKPLEADVHYSNSQNKNEQNTHSESGQTFLQGLVEQAAKVAENVMQDTTEVPFTSLVETQDTETIMRQMMDYMKLHVSQNVTEMEMQLQPASLGSVNLQIASQNGSITAHFTVQNEGVKEALESQIIQLKENLDERGIKVDSVEVTIASHEFERNLEQNGNQQAQDSEKTEETKKTNRRGIVLNDSEELSDTLEESDRIQVELMQQNGNTVNFMA